MRVDTVPDKPPAPQRSRSPRHRAASEWFLARARALTPMATLAVLVIVFSAASDRFLASANLMNIIVQTAPVAIAAAGLTFVVLCAEIDLSFAAVATMSGVIMAELFSAPATAAVAIPGALALAVGFGVLNGFFTARVGIPSFMVTLAAMQICEGITIYTSKGRPYFEVPEILRWLGGGRIGAVPVIVLAATVVLLLGHLVLSHTRYGRYVYLVGGNRQAAELAGVRVHAVVLTALTISGATAGLAGLLLAGRLDSAQPGLASDMLLNGIAAVVLGGTSLFGGEGGIRHTIIGLLILGVLSNGLDLIPDLNVYLKTGIQGVILLGALVINVLALRLGATHRRIAAEATQPAAQS